MRSEMFAFGVLITLVVGNTAAAEPVELRIAENGQAHYPVVIAADASERTEEAAVDLAEYLGRMSGTDFEVRVGDGTRGLAVGVEGDFPDIDHDAISAADDRFPRDDYLLRTHSDGAHLIGANELATHLAVWDFLHHLGYRLYFPTDTWEIVPERDVLRLAIDAVERPDYVVRRAPRGAPWSNTELWDRWRLRNRVDSSFTLETGHAYLRILRDNREAFDANPEYFALIDGERRETGNTTKFCLGNEELRELVVAWAVDKVEREPERDSVSMDPSDGADWCECEACAAMGSVSDRVLILANEVAQAINELGLGSKYVGLYAYNQHSAPPSIEVHPNVVISVATAFIKGGYTLDELVEGWQAQGATLGIREYHDVFAWSHGRPREARGGDLAYLQRTIPDLHEQRARFMISEARDSWGANGLGYWITPRLLWDLDEAERVDELVDDFLDNAFGSARDPMREFYHLLNRDRDTIRTGEDMVARMYRLLDEARSLTDDPGIQKRLDDLVLYTHYLELYHVYRDAEGDARQAAFERIVRHAYRIHDRMMISTAEIGQNNRSYRDDQVEVPVEAEWDVPEEDNPWKSDAPFTDEQIASILESGIETHEPTVLDFETVDYSTDLVPAAWMAMDLSKTRSNRHDGRFRGTRKFYTYLPEDKSQLEIEVTGGLIEHYRDRGNVRIELYLGQADDDQLVASDDSVPPDGGPRNITLSTPHAGLHTLIWRDGSDMTRVIFPDELPFTVRSCAADRMRFQGRWSLYFFVPHGTEVVGGYTTNNTGRVLDGEGDVVFSFDQLDGEGYFSIPVPEGRDGMIWKFDNCSGRRMLMSVPPYLAPSPADLLLPREVVEAHMGSE